MSRRLLTRCCVLLLAGILLAVQAPWVHAMPHGASHAASHAAEAAGTHAAAATADVPPCHGEAPAAPAPADGDDDCCGGVHCDGHCAHPAWAPAPRVPVCAGPRVLPPEAPLPARAGSMRPDELLRPPI